MIDLLIEETKEANEKGKEFDIAKSVNAQLPFFCCKNIVHSREHQKDIERYIRTNPGMVVFFWVYWPKQERYGIEVKQCCGVWFARMDKLKKICDSAPVKHYENRSGEDGNKVTSYIIDLNDLRLMF